MIACIVTMLLPLTYLDAAKHSEFNAQRNIYATTWARLKHQAELGDPDALFTLGSYYYEPPKGSSFRKSLKKASQFYFESALRKNAAAQYNFAYMLHQGLGVKKDLIEAYAWFTIASKNESTVAKQVKRVSNNAIKLLKQQLTKEELQGAKERILFLTEVITSERYRRAKYPE